MKIARIEKTFRNVISNIVIILLVMVVCVGCFMKPMDDDFTETVNSEYGGTIYAGDKASKNISLMINVYWGTEYLSSMLETLDKYGAKATFFVGGTWVSDNRELLKTIFEKGHEIGNHGQTHKEHGKLDYTKNLTEIQTCHEIVKDVLGVNMELFAPPGGSYNSNTISASKFLNYKTIMWTRDTIDWRDKNTDLIYNRAVMNLSGGDLILMHPTKNTAEALDRILARITNSGFRAVTVTQTLGL